MAHDARTLLHLAHAYAESYAVICRTSDYDLDLKEKALQRDENRQALEAAVNHVIAERDQARVAIGSHDNGNTDDAWLISVPAEQLVALRRAAWALLKLSAAMEDLSEAEAGWLTDDDESVGVFLVELDALINARAAVNRLGIDDDDILLTLSLGPSLDEVAERTSAAGGGEASRGGD